VGRLLSNHPNKEVLIVETGWKWTDGDCDSYVNFMDNSRVVNYPHTPQGQLDFLNALKDKLIQKGAKGMLYWEPGWISGSSMCDLWGKGSSYDDVAIFDCDGKALAGWDVFKCDTTSKEN